MCLDNPIVSCVHRFGAWHRLMSHVPKVAVCRECLWRTALQVSPAFGRRNKYIYCRCWPPGKFRHASGRRNKKYLLSLPVKNSRGATNINTLYTYIHIVYTYFCGLLPPVGVLRSFFRFLLCAIRLAWKPFGLVSPVDPFFTAPTGKKLDRLTSLCIFCIFATWELYRVTSNHSVLPFLAAFRPWLPLAAALPVLTRPHRHS